MIWVRAATLIEHAFRDSAMRPLCGTAVHLPVPARDLPTAAGDVRPCRAARLLRPCATCDAIVARVGREAA